MLNEMAKLKALIEKRRSLLNLLSDMQNQYFKGGAFRVIVGTGAFTKNYKDEFIEFDRDLMSEYVCKEIEKLDDLISEIEEEMGNE